MSYLLWYAQTTLDAYVSQRPGLNRTGFCCERKDRLEKGGGGVACYVAETIPYERLHGLEEDGREVMAKI